MAVVTVNGIQLSSEQISIIRLALELAENQMRSPPLRLVLPDTYAERAKEFYAIHKMMSDESLGVDGARPR